MRPATPAIFLPKAATMHPVRPENVGKERKSTLLRIAKALIERRARIGDALERCTQAHHGVGPMLKPFERVG